MSTDELPDRIERRIEIDASAERVYALVSRPGWWVNDGDIDPEPQLRRDGDVRVLTHPVYGEFRLRVLEAAPPRRVVFDCPGDGGEPGTTVEFEIADRAGGGVVLTVVEHGFAAAGGDRASVLDRIRENAAGWEIELEAARRLVTGA